MFVIPDIQEMVRLVHVRDFVVSNFFVKAVHNAA